MPEGEGGLWERGRWCAGWDEIPEGGGDNNNNNNRNNNNNHTTTAAAAATTTTTTTTHNINHTNNPSLE